MTSLSAITVACNTYGINDDCLKSDTIGLYLCVIIAVYSRYQTDDCTASQKIHTENRRKSVLDLSLLLYLYTV